MTNERIEVLELLGHLSELHPEMRMGQWMALFASLARGPEVESIYDVEDEELISVMRDFLAKRRAIAAEPAMAQ
ncbi:MAG: hypothetical protein K8T89_03730 [Planctomycetes bacterium]|nr:hypothetical protein [Planctomycetota bacterium]